MGKYGGFTTAQRRTGCIQIPDILKGLKVILHVKNCEDWESVI